MSNIMFEAAPHSQDQIDWFTPAPPANQLLIEYTEGMLGVDTDYANRNNSPLRTLGSRTLASDARLRYERNNAVYEDEPLSPNMKIAPEPEVRNIMDLFHLERVYGVEQDSGLPLLPPLPRIRQYQELPRLASVEASEVQIPQPRTVTAPVEATLPKSTINSETPRLQPDMPKPGLITTTIRNAWKWATGRQATENLQDTSGYRGGWRQALHRIPRFWR